MTLTRPLDTTCHTTVRAFERPTERALLFASYQGPRSVPGSGRKRSMESDFKLSAGKKRSSGQKDCLIN
jgi:hypothetical protein